MAAIQQQVQRQEPQQKIVFMSSGHLQEQPQQLNCKMTTDGSLEAGAQRGNKSYANAAFRKHPHNGLTNKTTAILRRNHSISSGNQFQLLRTKRKPLTNSDDNNNKNKNNNENDTINYNECSASFRADITRGRPATYEDTVSTTTWDSRSNTDSTSSSSGSNNTAVQIVHHSWNPQYHAPEGRTLHPHQSNAHTAPASSSGTSGQLRALGVTHQASTPLTPQPPPPYSQVFEDDDDIGGDQVKNERVVYKKKKESNKCQDINHLEQVSMALVAQQTEQPQRQQQRRVRRPTARNGDVEQGIMCVKPTATHSEKRMEAHKGVDEVLGKGQSEDDESEVEDAELNSRSGRRSRGSGKPMYRSIWNYMQRLRAAWRGAGSSGNDSELEELEALPRYRPESVRSLCRVTRFSEEEIKRLYRGFKAECPTGMVREETFKAIYSQFFPNGSNSGMYAHYVFNTLDQSRSGIVSFEDFVLGLSILSRGSVEEKLKWTFSLYDINGDGLITREEMTEIVTAIYELAGSPTANTGGGGGGNGGTASASSTAGGTASSAHIVSSASHTTSPSHQPHHPHHHSSHYPHLHLPHLIHGHHHQQQQQLKSDENIIKAKVERIFQKMDLNCDGVVTMDEFLESCCTDDTICRSLAAFDSSF